MGQTTRCPRSGIPRQSRCSLAAARRSGARNRRHRPGSLAGAVDILFVEGHQAAFHQAPRTWRMLTRDSGVPVGRDAGAGCGSAPGPAARGFPERIDHFQPGPGSSSGRPPSTSVDGRMGHRDAPFVDEWVAGPRRSRASLLAACTCSLEPGGCGPPLWLKTNERGKTVSFFPSDLIGIAYHSRMLSRCSCGSASICLSLNGKVCHCWRENSSVWSR